MNRQKTFECWNHAKQLLNTKSSRKSDFITPRTHRILLPSDIQQAAYVCYSIHLQCLLQLIPNLQSGAYSSSRLNKCYVLLHNHIWREKKNIMRTLMYLLISHFWLSDQLLLWEEMRTWLILSQQQWNRTTVTFCRKYLNSAAGFWSSCTKPMHSGIAKVGDVGQDASLRVLWQGT